MRPQWEYLEVALTTQGWMGSDGSVGMLTQVHATDAPDRGFQSVAALCTRLGEGTGGS